MIFAVGAFMTVTVSALKMVAIIVSEMSVNTVPATATTRHCNPENDDDKDDIVPVHAINAYGGVQVYLPQFLSSVPDGMYGQPQAPSALQPG